MSERTEARGLSLKNPYKWEEVGYPFDGKSPIEVERNVRGGLRFSSVRYYTFPVRYQDLVIPVEATLLPTKRTGLELSAFKAKTGYKVDRLDEDPDKREAKVINTAQRKHSQSQGYELRVYMNWHAADMREVGKVSYDDHEGRDLVKVTGYNAAFFQALRAVSSGDSGFESRGEMHGFFPPLTGLEKEFELDLYEPFTFESFAPSEFPQLAVKDPTIRETYYDNKNHYNAGVGHRLFISKRKSELGLSFSLDRNHLKQLNHTPQT